MSLPLPAQVRFRGASYYLLGGNGTALLSWKDVGLPPPKWGTHNFVYAVREDRLVLSYIDTVWDGDGTPPLIDGVAPRRESTTLPLWVYAPLQHPVCFDGWLLIGDRDLRGDRLSGLPISSVGGGGTHFELGFIEGTLLETIDLRPETERLFSQELRKKRGRVSDPKLIDLLERLEERYRIRLF